MAATTKTRKSVGAADSALLKADPATYYAKKVVEGVVVAGPHVRDQCARHLRDLKDGPKRGLLWDPEAAQRLYDFFAQTLYLGGGEHEGKPFNLELFQKFIVGSLFGWKWKKTGFRRFNTAYIEEAKGNGKSPLDGGMGLYMMIADGEPRAEVYSAAANKDQARIVFSDALAMVDQSPFFRSLIKRKRIIKNGQNPVWQLTFIKDPATGDTRFFKPISPEGGKSGPRPHCAIAGELHEWEDDYVLDMLRFGFKNRRQPLLIIETNTSSEPGSVCSKEREYATKVASGEMINDKYFPFVCSLDAEDIENRAWVDRPECWIKANPGLGAIIQPEYIEDLIRLARGFPGKLAQVARLNMCINERKVEPWIEEYLWKGCLAEFDPADLRGLPLYLALDLSGSRDLTALALIWDDVEGRLGEANTLYTDVRFWAPKGDGARDLLAERDEIEVAHYVEWEREGYLTGIDGLSIDPGFVAKVVAELTAEHDVRGLAYDPYRMKDFMRTLKEFGVRAWIYDGPEEPAGEGLMLVTHGQGSIGGASERTMWMPRSIDAIEQAITEDKFRWRRNPLLNYCSMNARHITDRHDNRLWEKIVPQQRIDGIVAACMGVGLARVKLEVKKKAKLTKAQVFGGFA